MRKDRFSFLEGGSKLIKPIKGTKRVSMVTKLKNGK